MSTGSLGQGISAAVGMALANKIDENGARVYSVLGDGELQEGMVWEAAMAAAHYGLSNLTILWITTDFRSTEEMKTSSRWLRSQKSLRASDGTFRKSTDMI